MMRVRWVFGAVAWLSTGGAFALAPSAPASAGGPLEQALRSFEREAAAHPEAYVERAERAWTDLSRGPARAWVGASLDTLPVLASDANLMRMLRAYYQRQLTLDFDAMTRERAAAVSPWTQSAWDEALRTQYVLLRRQYKKSETRARIDGDTLTLLGPGWPRFQADLALLRGDTAAARAAYYAGWQRFGVEDDFIARIRLRRAAEDALYEEGLRVHPASPGVQTAVFEAWLADWNATHRREALEKARRLASRAQAELWPQSVEWKIHHAQALLAGGETDAASSALLGALTLLDQDKRLQPGAPEATRLRREIFALLRETK